MSTPGTGHKPESLAVGAVLTTLSFLCVALVGALGKAAGQLTSTAVVVLFQNLICFMVMIPVAIRGGPASLRTDRIGLMSCVPRPEPLAGTRCLWQSR